MLVIIEIEEAYTKRRHCVFVESSFVLSLERQFRIEEMSRMFHTLKEISSLLQAVFQCPLYDLVESASGSNFNRADISSARHIPWLANPIWAPSWLSSRRWGRMQSRMTTSALCATSFILSPWGNRASLSSNSGKIPSSFNSSNVLLFGIDRGVHGHPSAIPKCCSRRFFVTIRGGLGSTWCWITARAVQCARWRSDA